MCIRDSPKSDRDRRVEYPPRWLSRVLSASEQGGSFLDLALGGLSGVGHVGKGRPRGVQVLGDDTTEPLLVAGLLHSARGAGREQ